MKFGKIITVDFSEKTGKIKPLNGLNVGAYVSANGSTVELAEVFSAISAPVVRLSDVEPPYGQNQFVDIHCIFPDFSADESLPESYNFTETDKYIKAVKDAGAEVLFRLGESLDPYERKLYVKRPADLEKWARICEHIVMHYNEGFADGYKWKIKYWEIWNLPEQPSGWQGSEEEFFELYSVTASYLKEKFPKIKVGGYGSVGFSALNRLASDAVTMEAPNYAERFFAFLKGKRAPLDFFTWYSIAESPEELSLHAMYARNALDGAGFKRTASYIAGFNLSRTDTAAYPALLLASLSVAQKSDVDMMIYDDARPYSKRNALYSLEGGVPRLLAGAAALSVFGSLAALGSAIETVGDGRREIYSLGARGGSRAAILVVTLEYAGAVEVRLKNADFSTFSVKRYYEDGQGNRRVGSKCDMPLGGNKITLRLEENDVYLLEFENRE